MARGDTEREETRADLDPVATSTDALPGLEDFDTGQRAAGRFANTGDLRDLDEAIEYYRHSLAFLPISDSSRASLLSTLGDALIQRFKHAKREGDLIEALQAKSVSRQTKSAIPGGDLAYLFKSDPTGIPLAYEVKSEGIDEALAKLIGDRAISGISARYTYDLTPGVPDDSRMTLEPERPGSSATPTAEAPATSGSSRPRTVRVTPAQVNAAKLVMSANAQSGTPTPPWIRKIAALG